MSPTCGIIKVDSTIATISLDIGASNACGCSGIDAANTYITIRRDGPVYTGSPSSSCGNPVVQIQNCPILPGQMSYPLPTMIVPCPNPTVQPCGTVAPSQNVWYKFPPFVKYPLFEQRQGSLVFYLDNLFYQAQPGRYVADLYINGSYCSSQKLQLSASCGIQSFSSKAFSRAPCADMNPSMECC